MGDDVTVKKVVIYANGNNEKSQYIHRAPTGDFILKPGLVGAALFKPKEAENFINLARRTFPVKLFVQAVK